MTATPIGGDGREDLEAPDLEAEDRPVGARRDAIEERDRALEHTKAPAPEDLETRADHATGVRAPE